MIQLPKNGIIIAPANMHLKIYDTYKNCIGVEVYALSTFLQRFLPKGKEDLELLYEYKKVLQNISKENAFYSSINDANFLLACLRFLKDTKKYNVHSFPVQSQKEKDLNEILQILDEITLIEDSIYEIQLPDCSNIYILRKHWNVNDYFWIDKLLEKGAHWLDNDVNQNTYYYSCSNARKQMEIIAEEILDKDYMASRCLIALQNEAEKQVCAQILDAHKIPYTILTNESLSKVSIYWTLFLEWIIYQNLPSFLELIEQIYTKDTYVQEYFTFFPEEFETRTYHCQSIEYEPNNLISEREWKEYLIKEQQTKEWMEEHKYLFDWTQNSLEQVALEIQKILSNPTMEDISAFHSVESLCQQAYPYIKTREDLTLLMQYIYSSHTTSKNRKGVLLGSKEDINGLYDVVFLTGVTSKQFPEFSQYNGIFNESYVQNIKELPSLRTRLKIQKDSLFTALAQPNTLYCFVPQSDYTGKSLEESVEMHDWMGKKPLFLTTKEHSIFTKPSFSLSQESARALFTFNNQFTGSISRLEKMVKCPLSHFLNYGLYLNEIREWKDVSVRGTILHSILEKLAGAYPKDYAKTPKEEIVNIVSEEFIFARTVYPARKNWFDLQVLEISEKISLIFEKLRVFEEEWNMTTYKQEHEIHKSLEHDGIQIDFKGFIDRIDESSTSFTIFDYKSSEKELKVKDFETGVSLQLPTYALAYAQEREKLATGHFYISLKATPENHDPFKLGQKKVRTMDEIEERDILQKFKEKQLPGWIYQDISIYDTNEKRFKVPKKGVPTFVEMKESWEMIVHSILDQIFQGDVQPNYVEGACDYCKYGRICRNAKNEVSARNRIGGEDDAV